MAGNEIVFFCFSDANHYTLRRVPRCLASMDWDRLILNEGAVGGQLVLTNEIANYPGVETTKGYVVAATMKKQAKEFGCKIKSNIKIKDYLLERNITSNANGSDFKVVSFFTSSHYDGLYSPSTVKDAVNFLEHIVLLLKDSPHIFVILKEKKISEVYTSKLCTAYSEFRNAYMEALTNLKQHPRCYVPGVNGDPSEIIVVSDLVVTCVFSSPTIEALGARKKAIFYDPSVKFKSSYYSGIPGLIAHGYDELKSSVDRLLYGTSDEDYEKYLDREVLNKVEDYLDGKGLSRFRELLASR